MDPYIGELRLLPYAFAPRGWIACNGALLQISAHQPLYSLLGTTYGGDGISTFGLPDLRGRVPIGAGGQWAQGEAVGAETAKLGLEQMPTHGHELRGTDAPASGVNPAGALLASGPEAYGPLEPVTPLENGSVSSVGGALPHENRPPYSVLVWCIAIDGLFPPMP